MREEFVPRRVHRPTRRARHPRDVPLVHLGVPSRRNRPRILRHALQTPRASSSRRRRGRGRDRLRPGFPLPLPLPLDLPPFVPVTPRRVSVVSVARLVARLFRPEHRRSILRRGVAVRSFALAALDATQLVPSRREEPRDETNAPGAGAGARTRPIVRVGARVTAQLDFIALDLVPNVREAVSRPRVAPRVSSEQSSLIFRRAPRAGDVERGEFLLDRVESLEIVERAPVHALQPESRARAPQKLGVILAAPTPEAVGISVRGEKPGGVVEGHAAKTRVVVVPRTRGGEDANEGTEGW